jgi:hypothetical protein
VNRDLAEPPSRCTVCLGSGPLVPGDEAHPLVCSECEPLVNRWHCGVCDQLYPLEELERWVCGSCRAIADDTFTGNARDSDPGGVRGRAREHLPTFSESPC